ncbi:hypothetical protein [Aureispira anguillae]|uniref:Uncharacterized protein n=1 Tax=Aureispira anguillae TaxID=2864201 RepID=A0A915YBN1_9BACT|nr:hypothetical protein [Aureispira anguillae]BDS10111.1 hypothetical protein AsAng_0008180 [Aureispira anguillae]
MGDKAQTMCHAYVGTTGTGKTTEVLKHVKRLGGKVLVIIDNETVQGWDKIKAIPPTKKALGFKTGVRKILFDDYGAEEVWGNIHKFFRNGNIIMDDAAMYVEPNWNHNKALKKVVIQHRHISVDIFVIVHQFNDLPPKMWGYIKFLFIGKLTSIPKKSDIKVANPKALISAAQTFNRAAAEAERKGQSVLGKFYCYKNF